MAWLNFGKQEEKKVVLGIEIGIKSFCYAFVQTGKVQHILLAGEEELPVDAGDFLIVMEQIVRHIKGLGRSFDGIAIASSQVLHKEMPLRNVEKKEVKEILLHEMQIVWGLQKDENLLQWCRQSERDADVEVGVISKVEYERYLALAQKLQTELLAVTWVKDISFDSSLVYDKGYENEDAKIKLEENFCGAIYAALVGTGAKTDVNFVHTSLEEIKLAKNAKCYLLASKIIAGATLVLLCGCGLFYGYSAYKVYSVKRALQPLQMWTERYDECIGLNQKIGQIMRLKSNIRRAYPFQSEVIIKILDAMPEDDNEIFRIKLEEAKNSKMQSKLVVEGENRDLKQLREFMRNLKQIKGFTKVDLAQNSSLANGHVGYVLNLQYGVKNDNE